MASTTKSLPSLWVVSLSPQRYLKKHLDAVLGYQVWAALLEQVVGPDDIQSFLPISAIPWFCNLSSRPLSIAAAVCSTLCLEAPAF